jgi:dephospho-CoA kinase
MKSYEFEKRAQAQVSDDERSLLADAVIENIGDQDQLLRAIEELWESTLLPLARASQ